MARKKSAKPLSGRLQRQLDQAFELRDRKNLPAALHVLREIDSREPDNPIVLQLLCEVTHDLQDYPGYLDSADRLVRAVPGNPDFHLMRAGAYLACNFVVLALREFQYCLSHWPHHREAETRNTVTSLTEATTEMLRTTGVPFPDAWELGARHEQVQLEIQRGDYARARQQADKLLARWPAYAPACNNAALACNLMDDLEGAIGYTRRALQAEPNNGHALANLIIFLCQAGRRDEARPLAEQLRTLPARIPEDYAKHADAFAELDDAEGVRATYDRAAPELHKITPVAAAFLCHLAAVACYRLGDAARARALWQQALQRQPNFSLALRHLAELDKPPERREAPFYSPLARALPGRFFADLEECLTGLEREKTEVQAEAVKRVLRDHPVLLRRAPALLESGDPEARQLLFRLLNLSRDPALLDVLRTFALGQAGTATARNDVLMNLIRKKLIEPQQRVWDGQEWREVLLTETDVLPDPPGSLPAPAAEALRAARAEAAAGAHARAEERLREALAAQPHNLRLRVDLLYALLAQGRAAEADALLDQLLKEHPDSALVQAERARRYARQGNREGLSEVVKELQLRPRLYFSESAALGAALFDLSLANQMLPSVRIALEQVERFAPDHPDLPRMRQLAAQLPG